MKLFKTIIEKFMAFMEKIDPMPVYYINGPVNLPEPLTTEEVTRQESRSSAGPEHVTLQGLITWLIKSRSRD